MFDANTAEFSRLGLKRVTCDTTECTGSVLLLEEKVLLETCNCEFVSEPCPHCGWTFCNSCLEQCTDVEYIDVEGDVQCCPHCEENVPFVAFHQRNDADVKARAAEHMDQVKKRKTNYSFIDACKTIQ